MGSDPWINTVDIFCGTIFDQQLVKNFCTKIAPYPIGTCVNLSNGLLRIVVADTILYQ